MFFVERFNSGKYLLFERDLKEISTSFTIFSVEKVVVHFCSNFVHFQLKKFQKVFNFVLIFFLCAIKIFFLPMCSRVEKSRVNMLEKSIGLPLLVIPYLRCLLSSSM